MFSPCADGLNVTGKMASPRGGIAIGKGTGVVRFSSAKGAGVARAPVVRVLRTCETVTVSMPVLIMSTPATESLPTVTLP
jgi:hypothetical protein